MRRITDYCAALQNGFLTSCVQSAISRTAGQLFDLSVFRKKLVLESLLKRSRVSSERNHDMVALNQQVHFGLPGLPALVYHAAKV